MIVHSMLEAVAHLFRLFRSWMYFMQHTILNVLLNVTQSFLDIIPEDWKEAHMLRQEVQIRSLKSTLGQKEAHISKLEAALQCYQLSRKVSPDWDQGLPPEVLGLTAKAWRCRSPFAKDMREVSKSWQLGFNLSVSRITVRLDAPLLPKGVVLQERFPALTSLDLGNSCIMDEEGLATLAGLRNLKRLNLGQGPEICTLKQGELWHRLTGTGFRHLHGLPIETLGLAGCCQLGDHALRGLRGLPLSSLSLADCYQLTARALLYLQGLLPLTDLNLSGCSGINSLENLRGLPLQRLGLNEVGMSDLEVLKGMPIARLCMRHCFGVTDEGLEFLAGMPLVDLSLHGCSGLRGVGIQHLKGLPLTDLDIGRCLHLDPNLALRHLSGLPLTYLDVGCNQHLYDVGLEYLRGMPLKELILARCPLITDGCVGILMNLPLEYLNLGGCNQLSYTNLGALRRKGVHLSGY